MPHCVSFSVEKRHQSQPWFSQKRYSYRYTNLTCLMHAYRDDQQMTAFVALLTMDANRQQAGRRDWWCCCVNKSFLAEVNRFRYVLFIFGGVAGYCCFVTPGEGGS